jgi:hypothetical protein
MAMRTRLRTAQALFEWARHRFSGAATESLAPSSTEAASAASGETILAHKPVQSEACAASHREAKGSL